MRFRAIRDFNSRTIMSIRMKKMVKSSEQKIDVITKTSLLSPAPNPTSSPTAGLSPSLSSNLPLQMT